MAWNEPGPGRDPWTQGSGGGKRGDGPPDLEALLRRLRARFAGGGGAGPTAGGTSALAMIAVAIWLLSGLYTVDAQERGVVLRFGAFLNVTEPGLHWRLPWPIEHVEKVKITNMRQVSDKALLLTKDENLVEVTALVRYRVSSAEDYLFNNEHPDDTLKETAKAAVREAVGGAEMDAVLGDGRPAVADQVKRLVQARLDEYKAGLAVAEVSLQEVKPPDAVVAAFADAAAAYQDKDSARDKAESYAKDRVPKARGAVARMLNEAQAYHDEAIAHAQGDAARFGAVLEQYRKAPKVTRERLYLETMEAIYGGSSKVLLDTERSGPVLQLPLDSLLKNSARNANPADAGDSAEGAPARAAAKSGADSRARERGGR